MRKELLIIALGLCVASAPAAADVLAVPEGQQAREAGLPAKGISMAQVTKQYGEPREKRPTVGGGSPKQPPITRWDYDHFAVIFEHDKVVDVVIPGAPAPVFNKNELEPVAGAPPAPGFTPATPPVEPAAPAQPAVAPEAAPEGDVPDGPAPPPEPEAPAEPPAEKASPEVRETPADSMPTPR